jgi:hypothetical protein
MSLYNSNLKTLEPGEYTQPYKHATKLFVADTFRLAPKQSYLYYVVFEIDPSQTDLGSGILNSALEFANRYESLENGLLVKDIELPKFSMGTKILNAYNRKNIVQTNISYDPISVTFHDDAANVITKFWNDYYTYYFRDSDYTVSSYGIPEKYDRRRLAGWGYSPRNGGVNSFLKSIRIFSLHNKNFTEYYLVNPIINSWRHGRHESGSNSGLMENSMTVSYETVKYFTGFINPVNVDGFSLLHYDTEESPIAGSFLGGVSAAGVLNAIDGAPKDLRKPDTSQGAGGPLSSLLTVFRTYQNLKNVDLKRAATTSIAAAGASVLNGVLNGSVAFPTDSTNASTVFSNQTTSQISGFAAPSKSDIITFGSIAAGIALGASINSNNNSVDQLRTTYSRGITNSQAGGMPVSGEYTRVYDVASPGTAGINVDPSSMQPVTGTSTAFVFDSQGKVINQYQVAGTTDGAYNPTDASLNLQFTQRSTDASGNAIVVATYKNGTRVTFDGQTGETLGIKIGADAKTILGLNSAINTNPTDTRTLVSTGNRVANNSVQTITNPATEIITAVGGIASGRVIDNTAGSSGSYEFSDSLIGRSLSSSSQTTAGNQIGRAVPGGINAIIDNFTGDVRQGVNNLSNAIQNVVGSWSGLGGYNATSPYDNAVTSAYNPDGSIVVSYKNGDVVRFDDLYGASVVSKGTSNLGFSQFFNATYGQSRDSSGPSFGVEFASVWTDGSGNPILDSSGNYVTTAGDRSFLPDTPSQFASNYDREAREAIMAIESQVYFESSAYNDPANDANVDNGSWEGSSFSPDNAADVGAYSDSTGYE